jgi:hypothetical protein
MFRFAREINMRLQLIEPVPIDDDFVTGIATIEDCGAVARFVWYVRATCYESGARINVVKRKLLVPYQSIAANHALVAEFLAPRSPRTPGSPHLNVVG